MPSQPRRARSKQSNEQSGDVVSAKDPITVRELLKSLEPLFIDIATLASSDRETYSLIKRLADNHITREEMEAHKSNLVRLYERLVDEEKGAHDKFYGLASETRGAVEKLINTVGKMTALAEEQHRQRVAEFDHQSHLEVLRTQHENEMQRREEEHENALEAKERENKLALQVAMQEHQNKLDAKAQEVKNKVRVIWITAIAGSGGIIFFVLEKIFGFIGGSS